MKLATWNVNSLKARLDFVLEWLDLNEPDILCMQETKMSDQAFPHAAFAERGYFSAHHGLSAWNGVAIVSKGALEDVDTSGVDLSFESVAQARCISGRTLGLRVFSLYVPNGRAVGDPHFLYKLEWLAALREHVSERLSFEEDLVMAGDFNIAPSDLDVWDVSALEGATHVTSAERDALSSLQELGFIDSYRTLEPHERGYSWWDYRGGAFHKGWGMRIDLVLTSAHLRGRVVSASVDREARKQSKTGAKPSDHAPVVVELSS